MKKYLFLMLIFFAGCNSDLYTKKLASNNLKGNSPKVIIDNLFELQYAENRAIAFGLLRNIPDATRHAVIIVLSGIIISVLTCVIWKNRKDGLLKLLPLFIILAGAMGNLLDRIYHGYVIDFIHLHYKEKLSWPVFNVADILICVGVGLLLFQAFISEGSVSQAKAEEPE